MYDSDLDDSAESSDDEEDDGKSTSGDEWVVMLLTDSQHVFIVLSVYVRRRPLFSFLNFYTVGRTPWMGD
jgi:hypothetical protein